MRICQTWQEAVAAAGLSSVLPSYPPLALTDFPAFNAYQASELSERDYLRELAALLGIPEERAIDVHTAILREPYPGIERVIDGLEADGIRTGCLSNTNSPHWAALTDPARFAVVARLTYRAGSHELGYAKPDPRAFEAYIDQFGLQGADVAFFDDGAANVDTARSLGWHAFLVDPSADPPAQIAARLSEWSRPAPHFGP